MRARRMNGLITVCHLTGLVAAMLVAGCGGGRQHHGGGGDLGSAGDLGVAFPDLGPASGDGGFDRDAACAQVTAQATLQKKPVDILIAIDNSGSMSDKIAAVERNINQNFAAILGASGLDYRVILISKLGSHGTFSGTQGICVGPPLGGAPCSPVPSRPANTARFFQHNTEISSTNSLSKFIATYNAPDPSGAAPGGWSDWARPEAWKVFLVITDDSADMSADAFEAALDQLTPSGNFGDAQARNWIFHGILGHNVNSPATAPFLPSAPLQTGKCKESGGGIFGMLTGGGQNPGTDYQNLAIETGGLRYPICEFASFDVVFQAVAQSVIGGAKVACDFAVPEAAPGYMYELDSAVVEYTPGPGSGGGARDFKQVADAASCQPDSFYIAGGRVYLCPAPCSLVQADDKAQIKVLLDCAVPIQ